MVLVLLWCSVTKVAVVRWLAVVSVHSSWVVLGKIVFFIFFFFFSSLVGRSIWDSRFRPENVRLLKCKAIRLVCKMVLWWNHGSFSSGNSFCVFVTLIYVCWWSSHPLCCILVLPLILVHILSVLWFIEIVANMILQVLIIDTYHVAGCTMKQFHIMRKHSH